ncbi:DNA-binding protein P3A2-like [Mya arenaria]|uniref:DNA-binding protein P3A2-like n=1 Tax=Mya arenaria TaxID=6604 RepID=UPI0022E6CA41|nr:DNA-binding protein P3A2-like [Mya arenaria]
MNIGAVSMQSSIANTITINSSGMSADMMDDDSDLSSPDSTFDASELMDQGISHDDITSQLAAAGPVGMAAAAAITSGRRRKRPHLFETNPAVRKRQQTRLLRKLKSCIEEYTTRIGQQAVILCCTPSKVSNANSYKVFGSQPLESVIKNSKNMILQDLDTALAEHTPEHNLDPGVFELPALALDGIPTPIDKMTQAQLRNFIPEMLKYSTLRSKPGWGKMECRPPWWPNEVPWANVRSDVRTDEQKRNVSWTDALRAIVKNCYKHHGREDLLNIFGEAAFPQSGLMNTMIQTITNPDGSVSIIHIDATPNSVVTLPDGSQATVVQAVNTMPSDSLNSEIVEASQLQESGIQGVAIQPTTIELPPGVTAGRILMPNGDFIQISTDPATGLMTIPASVYEQLVHTPQSVQHGQTQPTLVPMQQQQHNFQQQQQQQQVEGAKEVEEHLQQLHQQQQQMMEVVHLSQSAGPSLQET